MKRENAGFIIIGSERVGINEEIVFGMNNSHWRQYVTWHCRNGNNYSNGHYGSSFMDAIDDFKRRVIRGY